MKNNWKEIKSKILAWPLISNVLNWSKRTPLPGFQGFSIYVILMFVYNEIQKDNLTTRANSVSFSFLLSIFPAIIFIFTLLPHLPVSTDYVAMINNSFLRLLPKNAHEYLYGIILDITSIKRQGLLSVGFILALYFSSSGMLTLMSGFDKSYNLSFKKRDYFQKRGIALMLTILMGLLLTVSVVLIILGNYIFFIIDSKLNLPFSTEILINVMRWFVAIILLYSGITLIYRYGPSFRKRLPMVNPGSILATASSMISSVGFAYFVNNFGKYNELYGSIGALLVIMVWLQINAFILIVGFELNAALAVNRDLLADNASDAP